MRGLGAIVLTGILLMAAAPPSWSMGNTGYIAPTLIGKPAADFTLDTLKDKDVNMTKFRAGQKAIIFFWATWCPHCRVELKHLNEIKGDLAAKGIKLVIINVGEEKEAVQEYMLRNQYNFEVFLDADQTLEDPYKIIGVPTLFFVNEAGVITYMDHALPENFVDSFSSPK